MNSELYLCVYASDFPAQALLRLRPELRGKPLAVMEGDPPLQRVCSLNQPARRFGVATGMGRTEMDCLTSVHQLKRSPIEENIARVALLECAAGYSPRVEERSSGTTFLCVLDVAGTEKLFGSPRVLAASVMRTFTALNLECSIAVSTNFYTSICMARGADACEYPVIVEGNERQALSTLPLTVLDLSAEDAETFSQWGVSTLGTLAMLPEKDLVARMGQTGKRLRELARGEHPHLFVPIEPVTALEESIELDAPVDVLDSLLFGVNAMIEHLISRATERSLSLAALISEAGLDSGGVHTRTVRPALPTNDRHLWLKLLHLDWIAHPPQAPVVSLTLRAVTGNSSSVQLGLFSPQLPEPGRLDITLARIRAVVGEDRVGRIELKDTHRSDAFQMRPFTVAAVKITRTTEPKLPVAVMRRLRPPEKVAVTLQDRRPRIFYFRGLAYQAETSYGPWRAAGGWWSEGQWSVEEWDLVARTCDSNSFGHPTGLLCCQMTHDRTSDRWQIEALYD